MALSHTQAAVRKCPHLGPQSPTVYKYIGGIYWDSGKENGNYCTGYIWVIHGRYWGIDCVWEFFREFS